MPSTVAFFGATGGCAGFALAAALQAGHRCSALARTPEKLTASMLEKGVDKEALSNLSIVKGDVRDEATVTETITIDGEIADIIVSAIGSFPVLQWSLTRPVVIQDATICEDAAKVLVQSVAKSHSAKKPLLVSVSTTGIEPAGKPRDVPFLYIGLYHWLLRSPHEDKMKMEATIRQACSDSATSQHFKGFVNVKPTLLMDGESRGVDKIRHGTEDSPAIGYAIRRAEVGAWIYANLIAKQAQADWIGKGISLTA